MERPRQETPSSLASSLGGLHASVLARIIRNVSRPAILVGTVASIGPPILPVWRISISRPSRSSTEGWNKFNREYWMENNPDFAEHFVRNIHSEPHSPRQIEEGIDGRAAPPSRAGQDGRSANDTPRFDVSEAMYRKIRCPVLMIHGDSDQIQRAMRARKRWREVTGAELVTIEARPQCSRSHSAKTRPDRRFPRPQARHCAPARRANPATREGQASTLSLLPDRARARAPRHRYHRCQRAAERTGWLAWLASRVAFTGLLRQRESTSSPLSCAGSPA